MSQARVKTVMRAQKDQGACEKCRTPLPKGSPYRWFKVGFRSRYKHRRCMSPACAPRPSELESSKLADVYSAQEDAEANIDAAGDVEDVKVAVQEFVDRVNEVAEEYREAATNPNTGSVFNPEAEERADNLESAASDLDGWEPDTEVLSAEDGEECSHCGGTGECSIADEGENGFEDGEQCGDCGALHEEPQCGNCDGNGKFDVSQEDLDSNLEDIKQEAKEAIGGLEI